MAIARATQGWHAERFGHAAANTRFHLGVSSRCHAFAIPSVFIIDREGVVRWAHADLDYEVRPSTRQLLDVLDQLG